MHLLFSSENTREGLNGGLLLLVDNLVNILNYSLCLSVLSNFYTIYISLLCLNILNDLVLRKKILYSTHLPFWLY